MRKLALLAALQVGFMISWAGYQEHVQAHALTFRIPLQPVDPYDLLRGRYFVLNPIDGRLTAGSPNTYLSSASVERFLAGDRFHQGPALVGFCPVGEVQRVCDLRRLGDDTSGSHSRHWSRARVVIDWVPVTNDIRGNQVREPGWRVSLDLGLDKFFLPNRFMLPGPEQDPGWELEVSHRPSQPPLPKRLWFRGQPVDVAN